MRTLIRLFVFRRSGKRHFPGLLYNPSNAKQIIRKA